MIHGSTFRMLKMRVNRSFSGFSAMPVKGSLCAFSIMQAKGCLVAFSGMRGKGFFGSKSGRLVIVAILLVILSGSVFAQAPAGGASLPLPKISLGVEQVANAKDFTTTL